MAPKRRAPVPVETVDVDAGEDEHNELCQKCGLGGGDTDRGRFLLASAVAKCPPPQCSLFLSSPRQRPRLATPTRLDPCLFAIDDCAVVCGVFR
jgi:hypothetical protein